MGKEGPEGKKGGTGEVGDGDQRIWVMEVMGAVAEGNAEGDDLILTGLGFAKGGIGEFLGGIRL